MFVVSTRNFPPEVGGMQNLMEGLCNALLDHGSVKVFADEIEGLLIMTKILIKHLSSFWLRFSVNIENQI